MIARRTSIAFALALASLPSAAQTLYGPSPYLSQADSPFPLNSPAFVCETFEDHLFNIPGASATSGFVTSTHFTGNIDSVDGDDGIVGNGVCSNCDSYFDFGGSLTFQFDAAILGGLPKRAGIVWTDGGVGCSVTFRAYDANLVQIAVLTAPGIGDNSNSGTTAEDRFFGIDFAAGIRQLKVSNSAGGIEVDHLQFELPCSLTPVVSYCTGKVNALGCTPAISGTGTPSAGATSGFTVKAINLRNNKPGILLYTSGGRGASPFTGGTLCLSGAIKRVSGLNSGGSPNPTNDCSGVLSVDMNSFRAGLLGGNPAAFLSIAGTVVDAQFWGRDPGFAAPNNTQLSNGLEFSICQ